MHERGFPAHLFKIIGVIFLLTAMLLSTAAASPAKPVQAALGGLPQAGTGYRHSPLPALSVEGASNPDMTIDDPTVVEGNSGSTNAVFTVSLSQANSKQVTVDYTITPVDATPGTDYDNATSSGQLIFQIGDPSSKTISVPIIGDTVDEIDETFTVELSNAVNATIVKAIGTGTIDDDDGPTISIGDITKVEGSSGNSNAVFTVSLSATSPQAIKVNYATTPGTATAPADYTTTTGTLTIPANTPSGTINVPVVGDTLDEVDETFTVDLNTPVDASILDASATGTIDDDDGPNITINDVTWVEGNSGSSNAIFTVGISASSPQPITVNYTTNPGSATAGSDYETAFGSLTFNANDPSSKTISVPVTGDTIDEIDETFTVVLSGATEAVITDGSGTGTIDDDDGPTISIGDITKVEGSSGNSNAVFTVSLSATSPQAIKVNYATTPGTATAPADYTTTTGTLTIPANTPSGTINVPVVGDTLDEVDETFTVDLSTPVDASILDASATGTIDDDDGPNLTINNVTVSEGDSNAPFTVTVSPASPQPIQVNFSTIAATATAGSDYQPTSGTLTIPANTSTKPIEIGLLQDALDEYDETFTVTLSSPVDAVLGVPKAGQAKIIDDDDPPVLSISAPASFGEVGNAAFTVTLDKPSGKTITVTYATANGTAMSGLDYTAVSNTLTFTPTRTSKVIQVPVLVDNLDEPDETFQVTLSNPQNAILPPVSATATGVIQDDDPEPHLAITSPSILEGDSASTALVFTVTLDAPSGQAITVEYATTDGTATAGSDYTAKTGSLTFIPGDRAEPISIPVLGDVLDEPIETFKVTLSNASHAVLPAGPATGSILDNDGLPDLMVQAPAILEGDSGTANATFTVTLSNASGQAVSVKYATADGSATAGQDYSAASGTVTFVPQDVQEIISVPIAGDLLDEEDETFHLILSTPTNVNLPASPIITATIRDNDPTPAISIPDVSLKEGDSGTANAVFTVTLSGPSSRTVTVEYTTQDDTASSSSNDYTTAQGKLTFAPGTTQQALAIAVAGDLASEPDETFQVRLSNPIYATLQNDTAIGTIQNDDGSHLFLPVTIRTVVTPPTFLDNFDTNLGWEAVPESNAKRSLENGHYYLKHITANRNVRSLAPVTAATLTSRYKLETSVRVTPGSDPLTKVGMLFDWIDSNHFYRFVILPSTDQGENWWVQKWDANTSTWVRIASGLDSTHIKTGTEYNLIKLARDGNTITAFINDFQLWSGSDASFSNGRVGVIIVANANLPARTYAEAAFDYFQANILP